MNWTKTEDYNPENGIIVAGWYSDRELAEGMLLVTYDADFGWSTMESDDIMPPNYWMLIVNPETNLVMWDK